MRAALGAALPPPAPRPAEGFQQTVLPAVQAFFPFVSNPYIENQVAASLISRETVRQLRQCANTDINALRCKGFGVGARFKISANVGASARTSLRSSFHIEEAPTMRQRCANAETVAH
ncbi:hypothetical protein [Pandoraea bronchicola]|uniref:hypothetical protein n=1 Tax=Pandoraea bronchicola TaxID=2508287 RepID=UPI0015837B29|nr:hypothetical protein [Pandoraea bronchicola]